MRGVGSALCRIYGFGRKTAYRWRVRYLAEGVIGLFDRSRAPHRHPHVMAAAFAGAAADGPVWRMYTPQRRPVHRLQGLVAVRRRGAVRSVDPVGWGEPVSVALPGAALCRRGPCVAWWRRPSANTACRGRYAATTGRPFASVGSGGLSPFAVKLVKAGVALERIDLGQPQQNGRLE